MSTFLQWLLVWLFLSGALVLTLVGLTLASGYRALVRQNVPRPATVLRKRVLGWALSHWPLRRAAPAGAPSEESLAGRDVWLEWDVRWLAGGSALGRIEEPAGANPASAVLVRLADPITLGEPGASAAVVLERVWFRPWVPASVSHYVAGAVYGSLAPVEPAPRLQPLLQEDGQLASGVLVVL